MPDGGAQAEQQDAGEGEDPVDAEEGRDEAAEQRACHRADLLCGEQHAEDAPLVRWRCIAGEYGVDGRVDAAEEEAADELHDGKRQERVGDALDDHGEAGTGHAEAHGTEEAAPLAERPPERRGHGPRDAAEREDEARDEDNVRHGACELGDVCRDDRLQDQDDHLHERAAEQHVAQKRHAPGRDIVFCCIICIRGFLGDGRLLDDEGEDQEVREESSSGEEEGVAHADGLGEDAAEQGPDDAASRQGALHDTEAEAEFLRRCVERHDGEVHRPEARGKALKQAHERELARRLDDAAEEIADGEQETRAHGHDPLALRVGHAAPNRRHDG